METLLELAKYTLPAIIVLIAALYTIRSFLNVDERKKQYEIKILNQKATMPIRLQAYERLTLFLERISPHNLIPRIRRNGMSAQQFHLELIQEIRREYDHNVAQQIYVSPEVWTLVTLAKEETITLLNRILSKLPSEATEMDVSKHVLEFFMEEENKLPSGKALAKIKQEVQNIY
ncbi:MAG: hypothetical protein IH946_08805 [Bacteroidetes bacterium]|nr:hypothetical protein [Bacteroidota bacterium]